MVSKNKVSTQKARQEAIDKALAARLAMKSAVAETVMNVSATSQETMDALMKLKPLLGDPVTVSGNWALKEVECAREFNFELPEDLHAAVEMMEHAVLNLTGTEQCVILLFDEYAGVYTCLNDAKRPASRPRELTRISDWFLQEFVGDGNEVIHSYLMIKDRLVGIVVVSGKSDGKPFTPHDQMLLELLAPYLASKVIRFQSLKDSLSVPYVQSVVLEMAGQLVMAVDQDAIITGMLETFTNRLGFDACQYVDFNAEAGLGEVLYEIRGAQGKVQSFSHAGLQSKRRTVQDFATLVGLLSSMARNRFYLLLNGGMLGDKPLSEIFGIKNVQSALLLPVVDLATGEIRGTFNLFQTSSSHISEENLEIAKQSVQMASQALTRAMVLDKALAMASSDELTGLINRRGFYQRFEAEIERARRQQTPLCVALIDVDHFKQFNDNHGHLSGDLILKALSDLFVQNVRKSDVVCRFGGEEFAILLPDTSMKAAVELMERVRKRVERMQLCGIHGEKLHVTISAGVIEVNNSPANTAHRSLISDSLARADEQLYAAKHQGRNRVCFTESK